MLYSRKMLTELAGNEKILRYHNTIVESENRKILKEIGLPQSVAPYIDFIAEERGGGKCLLDSIDVYEYNQYTYEELKEIENDYKKYIKLASVNSGDIIAIDYNDEIVAVDHETLDEVYVNITLDSFLICIYLYHCFLQNVKNKFKENVFLEDVIEKEDLNKFKEELLEVDDTSLNKESFWEEEITRLYEAIEERD